MSLQAAPQKNGPGSAADSPQMPDNRGALRSLAESFITLFVAVLLFRTFAAEGYMISTGSMAPNLLGFHKRVECPTCGAMFPFGVAYDTDDSSNLDELSRSRSRAVCPNCGQRSIDLSQVPRNHGDQLLVNKQAYQFRSPQRWEVAVFRNPAKPTEAYVKRVIGLPGERVQISEGDVLIDGQLVRKSFEQQKTMRILVHEHKHRPAETEEGQANWQPRPDDAVDMSKPTSSLGWQPAGDAFLLREGNERRPDREPFHWVEYRQSVRSGGLHETTVSLEAWPDDVEASSVPAIGLSYSSQTKLLGFTGVLPVEMAQRIADLSKDEDFRSAVNALQEASHFTTLTDNYGYNPNEGGSVPNPVRDVMLSARVHLERGAGEFAIQFTDGSKNYGVIFDAGRRETRLYAGDSEEPVSTANWPDALSKEPVLIEASIFDRQLLVSVNGRLLHEAISFDTPIGIPAPASPVRFGARGLDIRLDDLNLYRDIFYTSSRGRHAVNRPYQLAEDEFFMLGDNSPVSHDSRRWDRAPVHRSLLLGKPFLVHLPSKPGRLKIGDYEMHLRLPDFDRIRFLK